MSRGTKTRRQTAGSRSSNVILISYSATNSFFDGIAYPLSLPARIPSMPSIRGFADTYDKFPCKSRSGDAKGQCKFQELVGDTFLRKKAQYISADFRRVQS